MRSFRRPLLAVVLLVAAVGLLVGILWATNIFGWRAFRLVDVETFIGSPIPAEAQNVQFASASQFGRIIWLRFSLPTDQSRALETFTAGMQLPPLRDGFNPFPAANPQEAALTWWTPYEAQSVAGIHHLAAGKTFELLSVTDDPAGLTIYVRAYTNASR